MRLILLFILLYQNVNAQRSDSCFFEQSMSVTYNIFTNPTPLPNKNYDTLRIYVLPLKQIPNRNIFSFNSNYRHIVDGPKKQKYQKAVIANYSRDSLVLKESSLTGIYIIQEALDSNNTWRPIEYINTRIFCSVDEINSYTLKPAEFCNVYIPRYCGSHQTKIRLKINTINGNIYSSPFEGSINYDQFYLDPKQIIERRHIPRLFEFKNRKKDLEYLNQSIKKKLIEVNK